MPHSAPVAPPSPQEVQRKLSLHSTPKTSKNKTSTGPLSGTESDSDSILSPDGPSLPTGTSIHAASSSQPPLTSIAERPAHSGDDSDEDEEEVGGWRSAIFHGKSRVRGSADESVIKAGYLWKKGERRKTWKKRWFVLRSHHLAYYKSSKEYQLLRLLDLGDVHSCTQVALKKHENTFSLVSPVRTFYLQASSPSEVQDWVKAIEDARQTLMATSTTNSLVSSPINIPVNQGHANTHQPITPSPNSHHTHHLTSSDSDDASPRAHRIQPGSSPNQPPISPTKASFGPNAMVADPGKAILSGYLMKCGSKRKNWRKRWFVLTGERLVYSGSHMDTKAHRQFPFTEILDALEFDLPASQQEKLIPPTTPPPNGPTAGDEADDDNRMHTFKIVTTKRTLLVSAPSEEEEIKWLGAIRALLTRRSEAGMVPGERGTSPPLASKTMPLGAGIPDPNYKPIAGAVTLTGKMRRGSASGGTAPVVNEDV